MAPAAYDTDIICRAEELFTVEGLTYERVLEQLAAEGVDVSIQTLKRWGSEYGWMDERKRIREALMEIERNKIMYRSELLKNAMKTLDPMDAFAVGKIEDVTIKMLAFKASQKEKQISRIYAESPNGGADATPSPSVDDGEGTVRKIQSAKDAVKALEQAVEKKLNHILTQPDTLTANNVKEISQAYQLIEKMKTQHVADEDDENRPDGLSEKAVNDLMTKFLGVGK